MRWTSWLRLALQGATFAAVYLGFASFATATDDEVLWKRQLGTAADDGANAVATDAAGNVYLTGYTYAAIAGPYRGGSDAWMAKYDADGNQLWKRQLGTTTDDAVESAATDTAGNIYLAGYTSSALAGRHRGETDAWVAKYDAEGNQLWKRQLGSAEDDSAQGVATDAAGNVYLAGYTFGALGGPFRGGILDAWVAKYDGDGNWEWARQLGTNEDDRASAIATDTTGGVYLTGYTSGSLGGDHRGSYDAWVAKYDGDGNWQWARQLGTDASDLALGAAADAAGSIYLAGYSRPCCTRHRPPSEAWLAKFDAHGTRQWTRIFGGSETSDSAQAVATDPDGNTYVAGYSRAERGGRHSAATHAWMAKYDPAGNRLWTRHLGHAAATSAQAVATDTLGNVYVAGSTDGSLGAPNRGRSDAWVAKVRASR